MFRRIFANGRVFSRGNLLWGPGLNFHDPNPPITLESPLGLTLTFSLFSDEQSVPAAEVNVGDVSVEAPLHEDVQSFPSATVTGEAGPDGNASGAVLVSAASLASGVASGDLPLQEFPPDVARVRIHELSKEARADGEVIWLSVALFPGVASGTVSISASVSGEVFVRSLGAISGAGAGNAEFVQRGVLTGCHASLYRGAAKGEQNLHDDELWLLLHECV